MGHAVFVDRNYWRTRLVSFASKAMASLADQPTPPVYIRLPKEGKWCPHFGLSRDFYYKLIREGAIQSRVLKHSPDAARGVRLIDYASVKAYLDGLPA